MFSGSRKSQPSGPPFSGKLDKPHFLLEPWALGKGFFCPHCTPMTDSIYPTLTRIMDSFSCSPLNFSFYFRKNMKNNSRKSWVPHRCDRVTIFKHYADVRHRRVASVRLFGFFYLSHGLVQVCKINIEYIIGVQWGPKNPNLRVQCSSGKRGLRSFPLNGGPEGWHFSGTTECQWSIIFLIYQFHI